MQIVQEQTKFYVNKNWSPKEFEVNEKMFLKIKPLRSVLRLEECPKISPRYYDPFAIFLKIGKVAYQLDPPPPQNERSMMSSMSTYLNKWSLAWITKNIGWGKQYSPTEKDSKHKKQTTLR
jgi:hypothetical protein